MFKFKRAIALAVATAGLAAPLAIAAPADAYAGSPGCVTLQEYRSITNGMTQTAVAKRFGTNTSPYWGRVTWTWDSEYTIEVDRDWRICNSAGKPRSYAYGSVDVWFQKEADWDTGEFPAGGVLSYSKSRWS